MVTTLTTRTSADLLFELGRAQGFSQQADEALARALQLLDPSGIDESDQLLDVLTDAALDLDTDPAELFRRLGLTVEG